MKNITLLMTILLTGVTAGVLRAEAQPARAPQNACGNRGTAPQIKTSAIVSPPALVGVSAPSGGWDPTAGRLDLKGIQYVSGSDVQVDLLTDGCTGIKEVKVGSITLTPAKSLSGTQPNVYWFHAIDTRNDRTGHGYHITVGFPSFRDGTSEDISITVVRTAAARAATYSFPMVHVARVEAAGADTPTGKSSTEIYNEFASALYKKFQGPTNAVRLNGHDLYGYDPSSLAVRIDSVGIWVDFSFKSRETGCDPKVQVSGTFTLDANPAGTVGLKVRWVNPVYASFDCDVPIWGGVWEAAADTLGKNTGAAEDVQKALTDEITKSLPDLAGLLHSVSTRFEELDVNLAFPAASVEIDIPYDAFDMGRTPTRFPSGQSMLILASGLGMEDRIAGASIYPFLYSGPNGVPRAQSSPVPNFLTVDRPGGGLNDNSALVGQLLVRQTGSPVVSQTGAFRYGPGCRFTAPFQSHVLSPQVHFGVNDTPVDAQRLRATGVAPGYKVRLVFFDVGGTACSGSSGSVIHP